jgi:CHAD domain-containing protein
LKTVASKQSQTLNQVAQQAIAKSYQRLLKPEAGVLKDRDPEFLHQMRTGMRRLRTAVQIFSPLIPLPKLVCDRRLRKIARVLGAVRDLDVLKQAIETQYYPDLSAPEQARLRQVLERLDHDRQACVSDMKAMLRGEIYLKLKQSMHDWLEQPGDQTHLVGLPIQDLLPDLLMPTLSQLFLHPGWLVGIHPLPSRAATSSPSHKSGLIKLIPHARVRDLPNLLQQQGETLHSLRKQIKRVRYQAELFQEYYPPAFAERIQDWRDIQDCLGQLQDSQVLQEFLRARITLADWQQLKGLTERFQFEQQHAWEKWQPLRSRYLDPKFRDQIRQQLLAPQPHN